MKNKKIRVYYKWGLFAVGLLVSVLILLNAYLTSLDKATIIIFLLFGMLPIMLSIFIDTEEMKKKNKGKENRKTKQKQPLGVWICKSIVVPFIVVAIGVGAYIAGESLVEDALKEKVQYIAYSQQSGSGLLEIATLSIFSFTVFMLVTAQKKVKKWLYVPLAVSFILVPVSLNDYAYISNKGIYENTYFTLKEKEIKWSDVKHAHIIPFVRNGGNEEFSMEINFMTKKAKTVGFPFTYDEIQNIKSYLYENSVPLFIHPLDKEQWSALQKEKEESNETYSVVLDVLEIYDENRIPVGVSLIHPDTEVIHSFLNDFLFQYDGHLATLAAAYQDVQFLINEQEDDESVPYDKITTIYKEKLLPAHDALLQYIQKEVTNYTTLEPSIVESILDLEVTKSTMLKEQLEGFIEYEEGTKQGTDREERIEKLASEVEEKDVTIREDIQHVTDVYQSKAVKILN